MDSVTLMFPHSQSADARRARGYMITEYHEFADQVRHAGLSMQLALSSLLIDRGVDTQRNRDVANERIDDMLLELLGKQWTDLRRRYDDEGGNVDLMPWPSLCEPEPPQAA